MNKEKKSAPSLSDAAIAVLIEKHTTSEPRDFGDGTHYVTVFEKEAFAQSIITALASKQQIAEPVAWLYVQNAAAYPGRWSLTNRVEDLRNVGTHNIKPLYFHPPTQRETAPANDYAAWVLRQISQLDPEISSTGTAVFMATEGLAALASKQPAPQAPILNGAGKPTLSSEHIREIANRHFFDESGRVACALAIKRAFEEVPAPQAPNVAGAAQRLRDLLRADAAKTTYNESYLKGYMEALTDLQVALTHSNESPK